MRGTADRLGMASFPVSEARRLHHAEGQRAHRGVAQADHRSAAQAAGTVLDPPDRGQVMAQPQDTVIGGGGYWVHPGLRASRLMGILGGHTIPEK